MLRFVPLLLFIIAGRVAGAMTCDEALLLYAAGNAPPGASKPRLSADQAHAFLLRLRELGDSAGEPGITQAWEVAQATPALTPQVEAMNAILDVFGLPGPLECSAFQDWTNSMLAVQEIAQQPRLQQALATLRDRLPQEVFDGVFHHAQRLRDVPEHGAPGIGYLVDALYNPDTTEIAALALRDGFQPEPGNAVASRMELALPIYVDNLGTFVRSLPDNHRARPRMERTLATLESLSTDLLRYKMANGIRYLRPASEFDAKSRPTVELIHALHRDPGTLLTLDEAQAFFAAYFEVAFDGSQIVLFEQLVQSALWGPNSFHAAMQEQARRYVTILLRTLEAGEPLRDERGNEYARELLARYRKNLEKIREAKRARERIVAATVRTPDQLHAERRARALAFIVEHDLAGLSAQLTAIRGRNAAFRIESLQLADGRTLAEFARATGRDAIAQWLEREFPPSPSDRLP